MHMDMSQEAFDAEFAGKMPQTQIATSVLCKPTQSKCTWTHIAGVFVNQVVWSPANQQYVDLRLASLDWAP